MITVEDTGTGIPSELVDRLFEPFFTTKLPGKGTGLGLSISRGLVKSYGGEITIESREDAGTRIVVRLPLPAEEIHHG